MPGWFFRSALVAGSIALVFVAGLLLARTSGTDLDPATSPAAPAPDFTLATLDGDQLRLAELRGKAVVVNFWGSWCAPCRTGMPTFEQAYRANRDRGVVIVGAAVEDELESARAFSGSRIRWAWTTERDSEVVRPQGPAWDGLYSS